MDYKAIQELIKTMNESGLYALEIESEGTHIKMKKGPDQIIMGSAQNVDTINNSQPAVQVTSNEQKNVLKEVTEESPKEEKNLYVTKSPIVGTFYNSSSPEKGAFVQVGTKVKKGSVLCIIEAMKLMNEIESEVNGEIVEILVNNEDMVEFGMPLFKIRVEG